MITLDVEIEAGAWAAVPDIERLARRAAEAAVSASSGEGGSLSATLLLTDDATIADLNGRWRGREQPTNVLSFPAAVPSRAGQPREIGDVAVAFETVAREAAADGKPLHHHFAHLVVHGVLHLLGHDHLAEADARVMEAAEVTALARLGVPDPYRELSA